MREEKWIFCPTCANKTRDRMRHDTIMINYPLFCPKCKSVSLIRVENMEVSVIKKQEK